MSPEISRLTGIVDADVAGRSICDAEATSILLDADFVVAHNTAYDRPFVERRPPGAAGRPWVCSMRDPEWRKWGFEGRTLSHLLPQMGTFYKAHRASTDVDALLHLLDHELEATGRTVMSEALAAATRPSWLLEARGAPFASKYALRGRGWRWNPDARYWWREVLADDLDEEMEWAASEACSGRGRPAMRPVDWTGRYAS